jgi:trehalose synthase
MPEVVLRDVAVPELPLSRLDPVVGPERVAELQRAADEVKVLLGDRTIWTVNSTAAGGGVAEMLQVLVGYVNGAGVHLRWTVAGGDAEFFTITKRLHNRLHGAAGDGGPLGGDPSHGTARHYAAVTAANAERLVERIRPGDVVLLHDPQTAGMAGALVRAGAEVIWRCHIGADTPSAATEEAWAFLRPHLEHARAMVFSRQAHVPAWVPAGRATIIPPSIDPLSPKNADLDPSTVLGVLAVAGVVDAPPPPRGPSFTRRDGTTGQVVRAGAVVAGSLPGPGDPLVVQVSRWDRLKDMVGVLHGFAEHVAGAVPGTLALVGPDVAGVTDDPEGQRVYEECLQEWKALPAATRARVMLVTLPMDDVDENAVMVNAIQRHAAVVVQKSLAEGFGLTVAEAMWKGRPVVGSAVGGIQDQLLPGTGVLLRDPRDLAAFGDALRGLLGDPVTAERMGSAARALVREQFVGDRHLLRYCALIERLLS